MSEQDVEEQCEELFGKPPIPFQPRSDALVDDQLKKIIDDLKITIPIVWIKGKLYLVGVNRLHLELKAGHVIAQVGGGYERFDIYITKNHKIMERQLLIKMLQIKESLQWIVDSLVRGEKLIKPQTSSTDLLNDSSTKDSIVSRISVYKKESSRFTKEGVFIDPPGSPGRGAISPYRSSG